MRFEIRALHANGSLVSLQVEALDGADAAQQIKKQGYGLVSIKPLSTWPNPLSQRRTTFPLLLFSRELLTLLRAGLSLVEAMQALAEKARGDTKKILDTVVRCLYEGLTFSQALQQQPAAFPGLYVPMIRASERTGDLAQALARYVAYRTQMEAVRKKVVSASLYPVLLLVVGGLVTLFLLFYVVPKFSHVYEDLGREMPMLSRWLMEWGQLFESQGTSMLVMIGIVVGTVSYGLMRMGVRQWMMRQMWRIPAVGEHLRVYELARFYRSLGMLLQSGVPLVAALEMASGLLSPAMSVQLQQAIGDIKEGQPLSRAMEIRGLSTPVALRMLQVGERSGQMGEMLDNVASFYDEELATWIDWFTKLFEPILMAFIGLIIGTIVVLMYMPIFELAGNLQ